MYALEHAGYLYYWKSTGEQGVADQCPSSSSFGDVLFWFLQGYSGSSMGRTSDVHRGDFLGLETSIRRLMFCSEWLSMQLTGLIRQYNIYRDPDYTIVRFIFMCTLHLHMLLTEYCTHVYSYIADDTIDV